MKEMGDSSFQMQVRTYGKPDAIIQTVQDLLRRIDPRLPFVEIRTLREEVQTSLWQEGLLSRVTSLFAMLAAFLAGIGLYGMLSYNVAQYSRDIGIRMALGAGPADIVRTVCAPTTLVLTESPSAGRPMMQRVGYKAFYMTFQRWTCPPSRWRRLGPYCILIAATLPAIRAARVNPPLACVSKHS
jgi:hypothetical protein